MALPKLPETETLNVTEARRLFSENLDRVQRDGAQFIVEKHGIPVAGIVPISAMRLVQNREQSRQKLLAILNETRSAFADVTEDEVEREIEKALAEIKQERLLARRIVAAINRVQPNAFEAPDASLEESIASILAEEAGRRAPEPAGRAG